MPELTQEFNREDMGDVLDASITNALNLLGSWIEKTYQVNVHEEDRRDMLDMLTETVWKDAIAYLQKTLD